MESSTQIKPCRVQITDLRRMKNREDSFSDALNESNQQTSTCDNSEVEPLQGACTVLIVPNQEPSTSTCNEKEPSEGTMLIVSEDGWIKGEPRSPERQLSSDNMSGNETDFDIDENDGDDDDWIPDPGSDSDEHEEHEGENSGADSTQQNTIDLNEPLTTETLKRIMEVVYHVPQPNVATLVMLKDQMDERPKLKLKLLRDLERGNSMFKTRERRREQRKTPPLVKTQSAETKKQVVRAAPIQVSADAQKTVPQWTPHQGLTLAKATAHLAAQQGRGYIAPNISVVTTIPPRLPQSSTYRPIAPKPAPQPVRFPLSNGIMNTVPRPTVAETTNSVPPESKTPQKPAQQPCKNITFNDQSNPATRAVFMPENRTVNIPELDPSPTGSLDVLVPVDATGQMKEPFMGIPLDSCNLVFGSDSDEETPKSDVKSGKNTPSRSSRDDKQSIPTADNRQQSQGGLQSSPHQQGHATPPSAGVFPSPQSTASARMPAQAPFPPGILPQGMVPVGLVPASATPQGVFPPHMFPPGSIPPGMVPVPLPPDAMRFPIPGPHVKCTCPPGLRPPGPPVHSLLHIQKDDLSALSAATESDPSVQVYLPPKVLVSPVRIGSPATTDASSAETPGIKIASVRSCSTDANLGNRMASSPKASLQPGASASRSSSGMGNHPGSLLTVILPSSAREHYKHKLNPQASASNPANPDLKEIHNPATKIDLGLVWNEISLLRTEIHAIKSKVASDIHSIKTDMEEFVKLVGARLGITPAPPPNKTVGLQENEGGRKRKAMEDGEEAEGQNLNKQAKFSSE